LAGNPTDTFGYRTKAPIIEAIGVTKIYQIGKQMVSPVSDASLQIGYCDLAVIFGPSGAGKSTLLNLISGVELPDVGEVFLKGDNLHKYSVEDKARIRLKRFGFVTQQQHWLDYLTIWENVALPLSLQGEKLSVSKSKAIDLLYSVGLKGFETRRPNELSIGQQQKASIARALINEPWIIFADEPTEHLDTKSAEEVMDILLETNRKDQRTLIMVTHDMEYLKFSKKWFFVKDGRLWDIKDHTNPFRNITEATKYIEDGKIKI